jgi:serine/threonine protein kinase
VATPIIEALGAKARLEEVVAAVAAIADTLSRLADLSLSHRDIKPENIYRYDGQWVVGDFGLVKVPGSALTRDATRLGPQYYLAPEMLNSPWKAQGPPADVYSLAKTLWVLATGQKFPIPGQHDFEHPTTTISAYVNHPKANILDVILQEATVFEPSQRPTAAVVKAELSDWLDSTRSVPGVHNPTEIKQQMKLADSRIGSVQDREDRKEREFGSLSIQLLNYLNRAPAIVSSAGLPPPTRSTRSDNFRYYSPGTVLYAGRRILDPESKYMRDKAVYVEIGVGIKYLHGGEVEIKGAHALHEARKTVYSPTDFPHGWDIYRTEPIDSRPFEAGSATPIYCLHVTRLEKFS